MRFSLAIFETAWLRRTLFYCGCAILLSIGILLFVVVTTKLRIGQMDTFFRSVSYNQPFDTVVTTLGEPTSIRRDIKSVWWNDERVGANHGEVTKEYWYSAGDWLLITWAFGVDESGKVISKHRYD